MSIMKHPYIFLVFTFILICSCSKTEQHEISGILYNNCHDMEPAGGVNLTFDYWKNARLSSLSKKSDGFSYTTTTNSDGSFTFEFEEKSWPTSFYEDYEKGGYISNTNPLMIRIPPGKTDLGNLYRRLPDRINAIVSIDFEGLSESDTVLINAKQYLYPFQAITDTIRTSARSIYGDNVSPVYNEKMNAGFIWQVFNNGLIKEDKELFPIEPCDTLIYVDLSVSKY